MKTISILIGSFLLSLVAAAQQPASPQPDSSVVKGVQTGKLIHKVAPVYPPEAKKEGIQGPVTLSATIAKDGSLYNVAVLSGNPALTQAAIDAVKQWKYEPFLLNGQPVEVDTKITVNFSLALYERNDPASNPAGSASNATRVRVSNGVSDSLLQKRVQPQYPVEARREHIQGSVILHALIDYDGKILRLDYLSGPKELVPSAVDAVKHWEYKPYLFNGTPVQLDTQITVKYQLFP